MYWFHLDKYWSSYTHTHRVQTCLCAYSCLCFLYLNVNAQQILTTLLLHLQMVNIDSRYSGAYVHKHISCFHIKLFWGIIFSFFLKKRSEVYFKALVERQGGWDIVCPLTDTYIYSCIPKRLCVKKQKTSVTRVIIHAGCSVRLHKDRPIMVIHPMLAELIWIKVVLTKVKEMEPLNLLPPGPMYQLYIHWLKVPVVHNSFIMHQWWSEQSCHSTKIPTFRKPSSVKPIPKKHLCIPWVAPRQLIMKEDVTLLILY